MTNLGIRVPPLVAKPPRSLMRPALYLIAVLVLLISEAAQACRPRFWSPQELAREAPSIFIAEVVNKRTQPSGPDILDLKVTEILKGTVPVSITTSSENIAAIGDGCTRIDSPGWKRTFSVGEKWIVPGSYTTQDGKLVPHPHGAAIPLEPKSKYLDDLRKALKRLATQKK